MSCISKKCRTALVAACLFLAGESGGEPAWSAAFPCGDGELMSSAVLVGDGRHVVAVVLAGAGLDGARVFSGGRALPAEVFHDPVSRLAVFRLAGPPGKVRPLTADSRMGEGAAVWIAGGGKAKSAGWVKRIQGRVLPLAMLKIEYPAEVPEPGTALTDESGNLVAVAHAPAGGRDGYAIPAAVVKRVVDDIRQVGRVRRGWSGVFLHPDAEVPRVTRVQPGSPAALAGIQAEDVLREIGSRRLADYADAVNAFFFLQPGVAVPVRVMRAGRETTLTLTPVERRAVD